MKQDRGYQLRSSVKYALGTGMLRALHERRSHPIREKQERKRGMPGPHFAKQIPTGLTASDPGKVGNDK
jgi:hypothetical protein